MKLLIFGPPGSGKGTLSKDLALAANIPHISTGALIREHIAAHDHLGEEFEKYTQKGQLAPDQLMYDLVGERLSRGDTSNGFLLDGFPRDVEQAKKLETMTDVSGVIFINIDDQTILERLLKRGRSDDTKEIIEKRIAKYHESTKPVLDFFKEKQIPVYEQEGKYNLDQIQEVIDKILTWQKSL